MELIRASLDTIICEFGGMGDRYSDSTLIKIKTESKTLRHLNESFQNKEVDALCNDLDSLLISGEREWLLLRIYLIKEDLCSHGQNQKSTCILF